MDSRLKRAVHKMQSKNCGRSLSRIILHFWNVHLWKLTSPPSLNVKVSFSNCRSKKEIDDMLGFRIANYLGRARLSGQPRRISRRRGGLTPATLPSPAWPGLAAL